MNPGIHHCVTFPDYQKITAVNPSLAKHARLSMKHYRHARDTVPPDPPTDAMVLGSATHCCVLEPDTFPLRYILWDGGTRRGRTWDAFVEANAGKTPLREDDYARCCAMRDAVRSHPAAARIFADQHRVEESLVWTDTPTGTLCKGRVDLLGPRIVDLKTCRSAQDRHIVNAVSTYGYHISMGAYYDGLLTLTGHALQAALIFVESSPPHDVVVKVLMDEALLRGRDIWHELLAKIAECNASGLWPGVAPEESALDLPAWEMGVENRAIDFGDDDLEESNG